MATKASTAALRRIGQGHLNSSFAQRVTRLVEQQSERSRCKVQMKRVEAVMNQGKFAEEIRKAVRRIRAGGVAIVLVGTMALVPAAAAANSGDENRLVNYRAVDRAEIESLQRWVVAGHEDWCKDARLVAAEELKRIASDFAGDATELTAEDVRDGSSGAKKVAFAWTPLDGRATYRLTVERFEWLLPIAKDADSVVWVPTMTEILLRE
jgi:hypothetical protein